MIVALLKAAAIVVTIIVLSVIGMVRIGMCCGLCFGAAYITVKTIKRIWSL